MASTSPTAHSVSLQVEALERRDVLSTTAFVTGLYTTLLHRTPQPAEVAGWVGALDAGIVSAPQVALTFTSGPEYLTNLVKSDYQAILGRAAAPQEAASWVAALQNGLSEQQFVSYVVGSNEYFQKVGSTNGNWINGVYQVILGRSAGPGEPAGWLQALQNGVSLQAVAFNIEYSPESLTRIVTAAYLNVLGRAPDPEGLANWVAALARGLTPAQLQAVFASSAEFINARGGLDIVQPQPRPVQVPVVVPVGTTVFEPVFGGTGGGCFCTSGGFTGGGSSGGFGGSGSGS